MLKNKAPLGMLLVIFLGIVIYVGCGEFGGPLDNTPSFDNPTAPSLPSLDGISVLARSGEGGYVLSGGHDGESGGHNGSGGAMYAEMELDSKGGKLKLGDITVDFPRDAVQGDTTITASITITDPSLYFWALAPENYTFSKDITISVKLDNAALDGIDPSSIQFYTWDETNEDWEVVGGSYDFDENDMEVETDHFSYWALASD